MATRGRTTRQCEQVCDPTANLVLWPMLSYLLLSYIVLSYPASSCVRAEETSSVAEPGVAVCGFSVSLCTVGGQRQYWGGRHRAGSSTGYSYRLASVCANFSLHTHNRHCVQFLPTPSFVLSGSLFLLSSIYLLSSFLLVLSFFFFLSFFLFRAGWLGLDLGSMV